jgi:hypothetical protein
MAGGIVPAEDVGQILESPFGLKAIAGNEAYPNPNRYFAHLFFKAYFQHAPLLFQTVSTPIHSVYLSGAMIKLLTHIAILFILASFISNTKNIFNRRFLLSAVLMAPLFQAYGYNDHMGIIDKATTYVFFYPLPMVFLLLFLAPFYSFLIEGKQRKIPPISRVFLATLAIILPFSGPLVPPVILIITLLLFVHCYLRQSGASSPAGRIKQIIREMPNELLIYIFLASLLSLYSLLLGTYNSTYSEEIIPIGERYLRLPGGIIRQLTQKLGFPLLTALILANMAVIKSRFDDDEGRKILHSFKWIAIFTFIYVLLLPLGGYRPYRPDIIRFDTMLPVTLCLLYLFGISSLFLVHNVKRGRFSYYAVVILSLVVFTLADISSLKEDECQREALHTIASSNEPVVALEKDCHLLSWGPILEKEHSALNAELLLIWNITSEKRLYYNKPDADGR